MGLFIENNGTAIVYFYDGSTWHSTSSNTDLRDGQWHQVTGTYDQASTTSKIYVDGVFISENMTGATIDYVLGTDFTIASMREDGETRFFKGDIDELRLYDKALNITEIQNLLIAPLAVETRFFIGEAQENGILLNWFTNTEINNKDFDLQHSINAKDWSSIGFIVGSGTTLFSNSYHFFDKNAHSGINYYRFKQIDFDGNETFSNTISVFFNQRSIRIYPNPTSGKVIISDLSSGETFYELMDQLGRSLQKGEIVNESIDISDFQDGQYVLKIQDNYSIKVFFVMKK